MRGLIAFAGANRRWIGGAFLLTFFSSFGQTFFIGRSNAPLRARFDLTDGEFGLLYMIATLASAATLPFLGRTLDHHPGARVARWVIPALAASCLALAFAPSVLWLACALYGLRLFGQGMMSHVALTETGRWFAANRGRATSLVVPGFQAGEFVFPFAFWAVSETLGWRWGWVIAAGLLLFVVLPAVTRLLSVERVPEGVAEGRAGAPRDWTRAEVIRDPVFYALLAGVLAPPFIGTTVFFHQGYFEALRGYPAWAFPTAFPAMAVTTVTFALVCGALVDRYGAVRLLPFFLTPLTVASLGVAVLDQAWGVYAFMVLFGVSYGFTATLLGALWPEVYGTKNLGGIRAVVMSAMVFATAAGPGLTGVLIDRGIGLPAQMLGMAAWAAAGAVILAVASRRLTARGGWASGAPGLTTALPVPTREVPMPSIAAGVVKFQEEAYPERRDLFEGLAGGQAPETLFITCSDSRISPNLVTQTGPGEIFVIRNAGNIVAPHTKQTDGGSATIEYAIAALKVKHVVVCGHVGCGAMGAAMDPSGLDALPHVKEWIGYSQAAVQVTNEIADGKTGDEKMLTLIEQNVLLQLQHLRTHPYVAAALAAKTVQLHGWVYDFAKGEVTAYDERDDRFEPVAERYADEVSAFADRVKQEH